MRQGITAGFGAFLGHELLDKFAELGFDMVRVGQQKAGPHKQYQLAQEVLSRGLAPILYCEADHLIFAPDGIDVEVIDVPDPTMDGLEPSFRRTPEEYADILNAVAPIVVAKGLKAWACLTGLDSKALGWTANVLRILDPCYGVSVHRYPPGNATRWADSNWGGRRTEIKNLRKVIGDRPWVVGEFGWHQGPRQTFWDKFLNRHRHISDKDQANFIDRDFSYWEEAGAKWACLYQHQDGLRMCPDHPYYARIHSDGYGIYRPLSGQWKPSADQVRR